MDAASNIFSYCVGALALLSTMVSILLFSRIYFPHAQMKVLDDLLVETRTLYLKADSEGLLPPDVSGPARSRLLIFESRSDTLREITYRTFSFVGKFLALFRGQTRTIMRLAYEVEHLRAFLMTTSQREKARRLALQTAQQHLMQESDINADICNVVGLIDELPRDGRPHETTTGLTSSTVAHSTVAHSRNHSIYGSMSYLPPLPDEPPPQPACIFCSLAQWWAHQSPRRKSDPTFPVPIPPRHTSSYVDAEQLSRSSTLVDEGNTAFFSRWNPWLFSSWKGGRYRGKEDRVSDVDSRSWNRFYLWITRTHRKDPVSNGSTTSLPAETLPV